MLLGYIPVMKLKCFLEANRKTQSQMLFHHCMWIMLSQLVSVGQNGIDMVCADGGIHQVFPLLTAYIADFLKQALVACTKENWCPVSLCQPADHGAPLAEIFKDE